MGTMATKFLCTTVAYCRPILCVYYCHHDDHVCPIHLCGAYQCGWSMYWELVGVNKLIAQCKCICICILQLVILKVLAQTAESLNQAFKRRHNFHTTRVSRLPFNSTFIFSHIKSLVFGVFFSDLPCKPSFWGH